MFREFNRLMQMISSFETRVWSSLLINIKVLFTKSTISTSISGSRFFRASCVMTRGKIPDRWEEYEAVGKVIKGTRFISFKVPLNKRLSLHLASGVKQFTPQDLQRLMKESNLELGLVIDLTNTTRYYDCQEITTEGIGYEKIFTVGHNVPSKEVQESFFRAVDNFLALNKNNDHLIGVHCTHGLNRTGYLVCRYMIDKLNFTPDDAIKAFNEARGHEIEREHYLNDLRGKPSTDCIEENDVGNGQIKTNCTTPLNSDPGRVKHADFRSGHSIGDNNAQSLITAWVGQELIMNTGMNICSILIEMVPIRTDVNIGVEDPRSLIIMMEEIGGNRSNTTTTATISHPMPKLRITVGAVKVTMRGWATFGVGEIFMVAGAQAQTGDRLTITALSDGTATMRVLTVIVVMTIIAAADQGNVIRKS